MRRIRCPRCRKTVVIPDGKRDAVVACPGCSARIRIPDQQSGSGAIRTQPAAAPAQMMAGAVRPAAAAGVRLRCAKCETVFPSNAKPGALVSCPKCGASIRPNLPASPKGESAKGESAGRAKVKTNPGRPAAIVGKKQGSSVPGRSGLNPMTETFLDNMEVLNRSAAGMEMLAPNGAAAGVVARNGRSGRKDHGRGALGSIFGEGVPPVLQWLILGLVAAMAVVGAVASFRWLTGS